MFLREFRSYDALSQLWIASTHRYPWRQAPCTFLRSDVHPHIASHLAAKACALPRLNQLPEDIKTMIWDLSGSHLLSRYSAAVALARQVSWPLDNDEPLSVSLHCISTWDRGSSRPLLLSSRTSEIHSDIYITVDSHGIRQIQCLQKGSPAQERRSEKTAFIVIRHNELQGTYAIVHFKVPTKTQHRPRLY